MKHAIFKDEIYHNTYHLCTGSIAACDEYVKKKYGVKLPLDDKLDGFNALYTYRSRYGLDFYIYMHKFNKSNMYLIENLNHEITHATFTTFDILNIGYDSNNNDHFIYYIGYIFNGLIESYYKRS